MFDISRCESGYITNSGVVGGSDIYLVSDYIPFFNGEKISISGNVNFRQIGYALFKKDKTYISRETQQTIKELTVTANNSEIGYIRVWFNVSADLSLNTTNILNYEPQIEKNETSTLYEEHKSQTYTIPTQQPFRAIGDIRDTFIKKNNKWYERHYIPRKIFDGTETFKYVSSSNIIYTDIFTDRLLGKDNLISSHFKVVNNRSYETMELNTITGDNANKNRIIFKTEYTNAEDFKALLTAQYNAGTPVYVDYIAETPLDIECTPEQSTILNQLYNTTIYIPTTHIYCTDKISAINTLKYNYILPSPSPEVPSEVESCGDNVNLFDINDMLFIDNAATSYLLSNNTLKVTNTTNNQNTYVRYKVLDIRKLAGKTLTISANAVCSSNNVACMNLGYCDLNGGNRTSIGYSTSTRNGQIYYTFTLPSELSDTQQCLFILFYGSYGVEKVINSTVEYSDIKIEKGTKVTPYSPYGQGCINEVICNKNVYNGESETGNIDASTGQNSIFDSAWRSKNYININDTYVSISSKDLTFSGTVGRLYFYKSDNTYISNILINSLPFTTALPNETTKVRFFILNSVADINSKIQIEEGTEVTPYVEHQSQTYTIPTQQPMRCVGDIRDTFIKKNNKWYERHIIKRIIMDGTANKFISKHSTITSDTKGFYKIELNQKNKTFQDGSADFGLCNYLNVGGEIGAANTFNNYNNIIWNEGRTIYIYAVLPFLTTEEANNWLTEQYNAGTPVYIDYILETPLDIECTEEQEIILEKIQNIKLYDGINYIYSLDNIEALLTFEYYYKMKDYDFYLSADGYLNIPSLGIRYLVDLNESSIPNMPESVESAVRVAGRDGDVVLNTTYEPITFNIVCCTEDNLTAMEKTEQETKINSFLNSIKNRTKRFAIERNTKFYEVKYNGALTTINFPKFLKFSIPFKSSDSYGKDIVENIMVGNEKVNSNTIKEVGALITIKGPAISPIIALNDYSIEYSTDIIDGARIEIDTNKSTVTHINSDEVKTNVMKYYNHQFPKIENGENELKILSGIDDNNRVNIKWNDLKL